MPRLDSLIVGSLLKFLDMVEVLAIYAHQLSELLGQLVRCLGLGAGIDFFTVQHPRVVVAVQLERRMAGASILGVIVCKLRDWQKPCSVILFLIHESTEVCFHRAVLLFCLPIYLRVERGGESLLDAEEVTERGPKLGCKNRSPVTYYGV